MKGRARRWIFWGAVALVILAVLLFTWLSILNTHHVAKITWSYRPSNQPTPNFNRMYLRKSGGCFAVRNGLAFNQQRDLGRMIVLDGDGKLVQEHHLPQGQAYWTGAVDTQGCLYLGSRTYGRVYAYDPAGDELWRCDIPDQCTVKPPPQPKDRRTAIALGADGLIYVVLVTGEFAVLNRQGTIVRRFDIGEWIYYGNPPAFAPGGGFYLVTLNDEIIRVSSSGKVLWHQPAPRNGISEFNNGASGMLYFIANEDSVYSYNSDGTVRWHYVNHDRFPADGLFTHRYYYALDDDGTCYISSANRLTAIRSDGIQLWSEQFPGASFKPFIAGDKLYMQVPQDTLISRYNGWALWTNLMRGGKAPFINGSQPVYLYILDKATGRTLRRVGLPRGVVLQCGPGPHGEFYGMQSVGTQKNILQNCMLVRIDVD